MMLVDESYKGGVAVTPSDTVNITFPSGTNYSRAIAIATAGTVSAVMSDGSVLAFTAAQLPAGIHKLAVKRINSTGTTATGIIALY